MILKDISRYLFVLIGLIMAIYIVKRKLAIESLKKYIPEKDRKLIVDNLLIKIPIGEHDPEHIKSTKRMLNRYLATITYLTFLVGILGLTYIAFFKEI